MKSFWIQEQINGTIVGSIRSNPTSAARELHPDFIRVVMGGGTKEEKNWLEMTGQVCDKDGHNVSPVF